MKRGDLLRQIEQNGCVFIRPGGRHDGDQNPKAGACQPIPRPREIKEHLARHILKRLGDCPNPASEATSEPAPGAASSSPLG